MITRSISTNTSYTILYIITKLIIIEKNYINVVIYAV